MLTAAEDSLIEYNIENRIIVVDDINEASRVARDNGFRSKVVTMDGQVVNAGGSFTGGSVQRSAGLFTRKQEMEELRIRAAKLQKDCLAAQEKTDQQKLASGNSFDRVTDSNPPIFLPLPEPAMPLSQKYPCSRSSH